MGLDEIPEADIETLKPLADEFLSSISNITVMEGVPAGVLEIVNGVSGLLEGEDLVGALELADSINITSIRGQLGELEVPAPLMNHLGGFELKKLELEKGVAQKLTARVSALQATTPVPTTTTTRPKNQGLKVSSCGYVQAVLLVSMFLWK